jgi:phage tail-like protein
MKNGIIKNLNVWGWHLNQTNGKVDRRNVTITLLNEAREAVIRWHAESAWIKKIEGPSFKAAGNEVAVESIEIIHEGLTVELA